MNKRSGLNFVDENAAIADIERLRKGNTQLGKWSLAQACWHCWVLSQDVLHPPTTTEVTPKQKESQKFIFDVNANGWPDQQFPAGPTSTPTADVGPQSIDDLIALLRKMAAYPHAQVGHPSFGAVDIAAFRRFILVHLAHHLSFFVPAADRRPLKYADIDAMIADIARLRRGYTIGGNWSLPQMCWHLNLGFPMPLVEEASQTELTEAQITRQNRWDYYIEHGHAPAGFEAPAEMVPQHDYSEADIDALVQRLHDLKAFKGKFIRAAAGCMPIERARGFILAHGALHLSCLHPTHRKREGLMFATEGGVITEVKRLRAGYLQAGNWTLAMVCWHLGAVLPDPPTAGDPKTPLTPHQVEANKFLDAVKKHGGPPPGFEAPGQLVPKPDCEASAIDEYIRKLEGFSAFNEPYIATPAFGAVETGFYRQLTLGHAARHLSFLKPIHGPREGLSFANEDEAISDIQQLRAGYEQVGGWSLPQVCWHLKITMQGRMRPGPHEANTPEQDARKPLFDRIVAAGQLPKGIVAPPHVTPPADAGDEAIDACIATLTAFKNFPGPFAPHRLFGHAPNEITHKQNLIHVAHHLSHLVPTTTKTTKQ
jgi:hypothetical protein